MADTTKEIDLTLTVHFEYTFDPGEQEVRYYPDGSGHPGSPPTVSITKAYVKTVEAKRTKVINVLPILEEADLLDELENEILTEEIDCHHEY